MGCLNNAVKLGQCLTQQGCHCAGKSVTKRNPCAKRCEKNAKEKIEWLKRYQIDLDIKSKCDRTISPREDWYKTNKNVIMALSSVLELRADEVADFLYTLTMQNFSQVLNPRRQQWNRCHVPLSHFMICDVFCDIFDKNGNVRNPHHPKSLRNLLGILQVMLKEREEPNNGEQMNLFGKDTSPNQLSNAKRRAIRAGIGEDSVAFKNGRRRRFRETENNSLDGNGLTKGKNQRALLAANKYYDYMGNSFPFSSLNATDSYFDSKVNPLAAIIGLPGDPSGNPFLAGKDTKGNRRTQLTNMIKQVTDEVGINRDHRDLVQGVKKLDLHKSHQSVFSRAKRHAKILFDELARHSSHHQAAEIRPTMYYGAQVPILMHEPFDNKKPWTWIRRHPRATRMNEHDQMVDSSQIHRYKRDTVQLQLKMARQRNSIRTIYDDDDDDRAAVDASQPMKDSNPVKKSSTKVPNVRKK